MIKKLFKIWPLFFILIAALVLRLVKLEELFYFTYDESVFAFVGRRMLLWHHVPLIGGVTPFGVHVAPYFYWFFSLILATGKLNPLAWGYAAASMALLTTIMIYKVGHSLLNKKVGITAAILWSFSYLANVYDRHFWGLYFGPLFALIVVYCLTQIVQNTLKRNLYIYFLSLTLALIIHADLSFYVFLILTIFVWVYFKLPLTKSAKIGIVVIIASFIPLIFFDLRHNFANTKPFLNYLKQNKESRFQKQSQMDKNLIFPNSFVRLIYTFGNHEVAKQYSYCPSFVEEKYNSIPKIATLISTIILLSFIYWSLKKNHKAGWKIISFMIVIYFFGIQIYGFILKGDVFEHYIVGLFPIFLLVITKYLSRFPKQIWLLSLAAFITFNLFKLSQAQNSHGLKVKREAIEYTMQQVKNSDFSLDSLSTCWKYSGYRYLFTVFGKEPVKSYVDPNFAYLYGTTPVAENHPNTVVSFVIHDFIPETEEFYKRYTLLKSHEIQSKSFGSIEVIIMDNSNNWF